MHRAKGKKVAVVGSGIAGLAALWALTQDGIEVELFEKEERVGGDAHTILYQQEGKEPCWVETAFLLLHQPGWPNFFASLNTLGVELQPSTASLSIISRQENERGWGSRSLSTFFPTWSDLLDTSRYRLLYDILRFNHSALDVLRSDDVDTTVSDYLKREGYSAIFRDGYLLPLFSCIHSIPLSASAECPIIALVQMFHNLRLLQLWRKPQWFVIKGGSQRYVQAIVDSVPHERIHTSAAVRSVSTLDGSSKGDCRLTLDNGEERLFDHVILATHSDVTRRLLKMGEMLDDLLDRLLSSWKWVECEMHVHHDDSVLPQNPRLHAAWNGQVTLNHITATFDMNLLLSLPVHIHGRILTTLNPDPLHPVKPESIVSTQRYAQPVLSADIIRSQIHLAELQGQPSRYPFVRSWSSTPSSTHSDDVGEKGVGRGSEAIKSGKVVIAGAWTARGIHEDGFVSGIKAAERVGARTRLLVPSDRRLEGERLDGKVGRALLWAFGRVTGWA